jgi:Dna[CI] antecedent, DciA
MKRSVRRHGALVPLGLVIQRETALRVPKTVETSPISARDWSAAVGTRIAARTRPLQLDRGVLLVRVASATWAQELTLLSDAIIAQLRGRAMHVRALRFRVGSVEAPARPPARSEVRTAPPAAPLPPSVKRELALVSDVELREAIATAAAKNLGWQAAQEDERRASARAGDDACRRDEPASASTAATRASRGPRSAGSGSAAPAPATPPSRAGRPGKI